MDYSPAEIETALVRAKTAFDSKTEKKLETMAQEVARKSKFLKHLFKAIEEDYSQHSTNAHPFTNPTIRTTEDGITYFEYDMSLSHRTLKNQIEICAEGYFVNYTSMRDEVYESDGRKREDCVKELYAGDRGIIRQILRSYAELELIGSMVDIENRLFDALQIDDMQPDWAAMGRKPQTPQEHIESSNRTWATFDVAFRKAPHPSLFY